MSSNDDYITTHIPRDVIERLEAGAFRSVCAHLRERSDEVQNIDMMTLTGFCRNCLAKWMVLEARKIAAEAKTTDGITSGSSSNHDDKTIALLNGLGYDEAAKYVYGMHYKDWKARHSKKASDDQMDRFNASKPMWAKHDKKLLEKKLTATESDAQQQQQPSNESKASAGTMPATTKSLQSNVCCQDVPDAPTPAPTSAPPQKKKFRELPPYQPPAPPATDIKISLGVLTVSDRASKGEYETGDLSGPAVEDAVTSCIEGLRKDSPNVQLTNVQKKIVPDDKSAIQGAIEQWANEDGDAGGVNVILTSGGTGFALRDITPEATKEMLRHECAGLMSFCTAETSKIQPLAALSRGTSGILNNNRTFIANLPGNPKGVHEIVPYLLPLSLHVLADIQA